jgi:hypothetical protein
MALTGASTTTVALEEGARETVLMKIGTESLVMTRALLKRRTKVNVAILRLYIRLLTTRSRAEQNAGSWV